MAFIPMFIKLSNVLAYFFLLTANVYSTFGPQKDDSPYLDSHDTYITPAPFVFAIWGVIHFLLGGLIIYQFFSAASETVVDGIHWHFVSISAFSALWLYLWQSSHPILALITILVVSSQVSYVYYLLKNRFPAQGINDILWIHAPFSLYHSWITVITVISFFAAFTPEKTEDSHPTILVKVLVFIGLLVLEVIAVGYIEKFKGDIAGAIVIAWSLYGVFVAQDDPFIHWSALFFAIVTTIHIFKPFFMKYIRGSQAEHAPLLG